MKSVIVYESMFGNTEEIARQLVWGISSAGVAATAEDVRTVTPADLRDCDLIVVGAPTHAFSMSRANTRNDAVRQGAEPSRAVIGLREWLVTLDAAFPRQAHRPPVAVFDTRISKVRHLPGSAARRAARVLRAAGFRVLDLPTSFYVEDVKGPPVVGEAERARRWGARLGTMVVHAQGHRV